MASRATHDIGNGHRHDGDTADKLDRWYPAPREAKRRRCARTGPARGPRPAPRATRAGAEAFKCGHCRAFIGPTVLGGRHRNHCPLCLYSRHVDGRRPGDRAGSCRSLMAPVARFDRPCGEPVLVHRCLGCRAERHNRLAADDNIILLTRLPLVAPRPGRRRRRREREAERDAS